MTTMRLERYAPSFNGVNQRITTANGDADISAANSIECFLLLRSSPASGPYFRPIVGKSTWYTRGLYWDRLTGGFRHMADAEWGNKNAVYLFTPDSLLHHLLGTWDGLKCRLYFDRRLVNAATQNDTWTHNTSPYNMFNTPDETRPLDGMLGLVRVYNRCLTPDEVSYNGLNYHNPITDGLVLWLKLTEGQGVVVQDYSGQGNNGYLYPAETPPSWERVTQWELRA